MPNSQHKMRSSAEADLAPAMRTFSCFISDARRGARAQYLVLAQSDERACELARRELNRTPDGVSVEIVEGGRLVAVLQSEDAPIAADTPHPGAGFSPLHAAILHAFNGRSRSRRGRRRS